MSASGGGRSYVIIIGAMKSGTTSLFDLLARHPAIAPSREKEPGFFAFDGVFDRGWDWYDGLFDVDPARHRYLLEASTDYTKAPFVTDVWKRMTARPGNTFKLLYIMRDPLRRIESHARHVQGTRRELGQQISPRPDHGFDAGLSAINLAVSRYAAQLDHFAEARAAGNLHCLTLEDLKTDTAATLAGIAAFLDLDPEGFGDTAPASNTAGSKRVASGLWTRALHLRPLVAAGKALLPAALRHRIRDAAHRPIVAEGRFTLTDEEGALLTGLLAPDMAALQDRYGVDVSRWRGSETTGGDTSPSAASPPPRAAAR